jgi:hypothetical protein
MEQTTEKPGWIDALEETLLLAVAVFSMATWIALITLIAPHG